MSTEHSGASPDIRNPGKPVDYRQDGRERERERERALRELDKREKKSPRNTNGISSGEVDHCIIQEERAEYHII